jgi:hypothetical protein
LRTWQRKPPAFICEWVLEMIVFTSRM